MAPYAEDLGVRRGMPVLVARLEREEETESLEPFVGNGGMAVEVARFRPPGSPGADDPENLKRGALVAVKMDDARLGVAYFYESELEVVTTPA